MNRTRDPADLAAGLIFVAFGLYFGLQTLGLEMGTTLKMGPGYFPAVLSVMLVVLGVIVTLAALRQPGAPIGPFALRGMLFILPAPILFGLTVKGLGFVPALFACALLTTFAAPALRLPWALALAAGVTLFSALVFVVGLGLPFRLFGPWLVGG